jgi:negative regulator of flagellin synthesis FlgM
LKIDRTQIWKIIKLYQNQDVKSSNVQKKREKGDEVILSDKAHVFQTALKAAKSAPDVRWAKIEEIKARMEKGQYNINSWDIASKMVDNASEKEEG